MRVAPSSSSRSRSRYYSPSCCSTGNRHRLDRRFSREQVQVHHGYCLEAPPEREGGAEVPPGVELRGAHRVAGQPVQEPAREARHRPRRCGTHEGPHGGTRVVASLISVVVIVALLAPPPRRCSREALKLGQHQEDDAHEVQLAEEELPHR